MLLQQQVNFMINVCLEGDKDSGLTRNPTTQLDLAGEFLRRNKNQLHQKIFAHTYNTISRTRDCTLRQIQVKLVIRVCLEGGKVPDLI
jgi:hypothetical protein